MYTVQVQTATFAAAFVREQLLAYGSDRGNCAPFVSFKTGNDPANRVVIQTRVHEGFVRNNEDQSRVFFAFLSFPSLLGRPPILFYRVLSLSSYNTQLCASWEMLFFLNFLLLNGNYSGSGGDKPIYPPFLLHFRQIVSLFSLLCVR